MEVQGGRRQHRGHHSVSEHLAAPPTPAQARPRVPLGAPGSCKQQQSLGASVSQLRESSRSFSLLSYLWKISKSGSGLLENSREWPHFSRPSRVPGESVSLPAPGPRSYTGLLLARPLDPACPTCCMKSSALAGGCRHLSEPKARLESHVARNLHAHKIKPTGVYLHHRARKGYKRSLEVQHRKKERNRRGRKGLRGCLPHGGARGAVNGYSGWVTGRGSPSVPSTWLPGPSL